MKKNIVVTKNWMADGKHFVAQAGRFTRLLEADAFKKFLNNSTPKAINFIIELDKLRKYWYNSIIDNKEQMKLNRLKKELV